MAELGNTHIDDTNPVHWLDNSQHLTDRFWDITSQNCNNNNNNNHKALSTMWHWISECHKPWGEVFCITTVTVYTF